MTSTALRRGLLAEYLGSLHLTDIAIGSDVAAQNLSPDAQGLELIENAAATAAGLHLLSLIFGSISGAHFNPFISFVVTAFAAISWRQVGISTKFAFFEMTSDGEYESSWTNFWRRVPRATSRGPPRLDTAQRPSPRSLPPPLREPYLH